MAWPRGRVGRADDMDVPKGYPRRLIEGFKPESIKAYGGRHQSRARNEAKRRMRRDGIKPAKKQWVICVETTAIVIPAWAKAKAESRLSQSAHHVWFRGRSNGRAKILERQDRAAGGNPELTVVEWRNCPVCGRMLLNLEAEARRKLDESSRVGRETMCGPTCSK